MMFALNENNIMPALRNEELPQVGRWRRSELRLYTGILFRSIILAKQDVNVRGVIGAGIIVVAPLCSGYPRHLWAGPAMVAASGMLAD